jgi:hypothetical protein
MLRASSWRKESSASPSSSDGNEVPVRYIAEQHIQEDLGRIPTAQDWLGEIRPQRWMYGQHFEVEET